MSRVVMHKELATKEIGLASGRLLRAIGMAVMGNMKAGFTPSGPSKPGQRPAVDTGALRSAVLWETNAGDTSRSPGSEPATAIAIGIPAHVRYGLYLELGALVKPYHVPPGGRPMHFVAGGQDVFAMSRRGFTIAPRPWMRPALDAVIGQMPRIAASVKR